LFPWS